MVRLQTIKDTVTVDDVGRWLARPEVHARTTCIDLPRKGLTDDATTLIGTLALHCRELRVLRLPGNRIGDKGATALAEMVRHLPRGILVKLDLSSNLMTAVGSDAVAHAFLGGAPLEAARRSLPEASAGGWLLDLSHNSLEDHGVAGLARALEGLKGIRLQLRDVGCTANGFLEVLSFKESLWELDVSENPLGASSGTAAATILTAAGSSILRAMSVASLVSLADGKKLYNDDGARVTLGNSRYSHIPGCDGTGRYYCGRNLGTTAIPGSDGQCGPAGGPQCPSCARFRTQKDNEWPGCAAGRGSAPRVSSRSIEAAGVEQFVARLIEYVKAAPCLRSLNCGGNDLGDIDCARIAEALGARTGPRLQYFTMSGCGCGFQTAQALSQAVLGSGRGEGLRVLNLDDNSLDNTSAEVLALSLASSTTLTELHLARNRIGCAGAVALSGGIEAQWTDAGNCRSTPRLGDQRRCCMIELDLAENPIKDEGAKALAASAAVCVDSPRKALEVPWGLARLHLSIANIGPKGVEALHAAVTARAQYAKKVARSLMDSCGCAQVNGAREAGTVATFELIGPEVSEEVARVRNEAEAQWQAVRARAGCIDADTDAYTAEERCIFSASDSGQHGECEKERHSCSKEPAAQESSTPRKEKLPYIQELEEALGRAGGDYFGKIDPKDCRRTPASEVEPTPLPQETPVKGKGKGKKGQKGPPPPGGKGVAGKATPGKGAGKASPPPPPKGGKAGPAPPAGGKKGAKGRGKGTPGPEPKAGPLLGRKLHWVQPRYGELDDTVFGKSAQAACKLEFDPELLSTLLTPGTSSTDPNGSTRSGSAPSSARKMTRRRPDGIKVLDATRAQNMAICLSRLSMSTEDFCVRLRNLDPGDCGIAADDLELLAGVLPTPEEQALLMVHRDDVKSLRDIEQKAMPFCLLPRCAPRLRLLKLAMTHTSTHSGILQRCRVFCGASKETKDSELLRSLFEVILRLGNYINTGMKDLENSDAVRGFSLESLSTLKSFKIGNIPYMHFLCLNMRKSNPSFLNDLKESLKHIRLAAKEKTGALRSLVQAFDQEVLFARREVDELRAAEVKEALRTPRACTPRHVTPRPSAPPAPKAKCRFPAKKKAEPLPSPGLDGTDPGDDEQPDEPLYPTDNCLICQSEIAEGQQIVELRCGHLYHLECFDTSIAHHIQGAEDTDIPSTTPRCDSIKDAQPPSCPCCRATADEESPLVRRETAAKADRHLPHSLQAKKERTQTEEQEKAEFTVEQTGPGHAVQAEGALRHPKEDEKNDLELVGGAEERFPAQRTAPEEEVSTQEKAKTIGEEETDDTDAEANGRRNSIPSRARYAELLAELESESAEQAQELQRALDEGLKVQRYFCVEKAAGSDPPPAERFFEQLTGFMDTIEAAWREVEVNKAYRSQLPGEEGSRPQSTPNSFREKPLLTPNSSREAKEAELAASKEPSIGGAALAKAKPKVKARAKCPTRRFTNRGSRAESQPQEVVPAAGATALAAEEAGAPSTPSGQDSASSAVQLDNNDLLANLAQADQAHAKTKVVEQGGCSSSSSYSSSTCSSRSSSCSSSSGPDTAAGPGPKRDAHPAPSRGFRMPTLNMKSVWNPDERLRSDLPSARDAQNYLQELAGLFSARNSARGVLPQESQPGATSSSMRPTLGTIASVQGVGSPKNEESKATAPTPRRDAWRPSLGTIMATTSEESTPCMTPQESARSVQSIWDPCLSARSAQRSFREPLSQTAIHKESTPCLTPCLSEREPSLSARSVQSIWDPCLSARSAQRSFREPLSSFREGQEELDTPLSAPRGGSQTPSLGMIMPVPSEDLDTPLPAPRGGPQNQSLALGTIVAAPGEELETPLPAPRGGPQRQAFELGTVVAAPVEELDAPLPAPLGGPQRPSFAPGAVVATPGEELDTPLAAPRGGPPRPLLALGSIGAAPGEERGALFSARRSGPQKPSLATIGESHSESHPLPTVTKCGSSDSMSLSPSCDSDSETSSGDESLDTASAGPGRAPTPPSLGMSALSALASLSRSDEAPDTVLAAPRREHEPPSLAEASVCAPPSDGGEEFRGALDQMPLCTISSAPLSQHITDPEAASQDELVAGAGRLDWQDDPHSQMLVTCQMPSDTNSSAPLSQHITDPEAASQDEPVAGTGLLDWQDDPHSQLLVPCQKLAITAQHVTAPKSDLAMTTKDAEVSLDSLVDTLFKGFEADITKDDTMIKGSESDITKEGDSGSPSTERGSPSTSSVSLPVTGSDPSEASTPDPSRDRECRPTSARSGPPPHSKLDLTRTNTSSSSSSTPCATDPGQPLPMENARAPCRSITQAAKDALARAGANISSSAAGTRTWPILESTPEVPEAKEIPDLLPHIGNKSPLAAKRISQVAGGTLDRSPGDGVAALVNKFGGKKGPRRESSTA